LKLFNSKAGVDYPTGNAATGRVYSFATNHPRTANMQNILIADDNATFRESLKLVLEAAGYRVRLAADGGEALALQNEQPADILLTDIFMPQSDGFEAIDSFRRDFPRTKIVVMSGEAKRAKFDYLSAAALVGVDATLKKPFKTEALLNTLRTLGT
jgi:CheY-like chemotaxis protein